MKHCILFLAFLFLVAFSSCRQDNDFVEEEPLDEQLTRALENASNGLGKDFYKFPNSDDFLNIPQDPKNPLTREKVALGKLLFHETGLAMNPRLPQGMNTYSCASCHHAQAGFQAGRAQGVGEGGIGYGYAGEARTFNPHYTMDSIDLQPLRSPSALNIAYQKNVLWNGQFGATGVNIGTESQWKAGTPIATNHLGFEGTEIQAIAGLGVHRLKIDTGFIFQTLYKDLFDFAFPNVPVQNRYTKENAGLAIAAYERTLMASKAPFQKWLKGETNALTTEEKKGAILFFNEGNCASCHNGPALNSMDFYALGMGALDGAGTHGASANHPANMGRASFTGRSEDNYKFKVPQLYNLYDSPFYGHGATFTSVYDVVNYKNKAIPENPAALHHLADEFKPLNLSEEQMRQITAFIEKGLRDPDLMRFVPANVPSGNCFPNNDPLAKVDMGCE